MIKVDIFQAVKQGNSERSRSKTFLEFQIYCMNFSFVKIGPTFSEFVNPNFPSFFSVFPFSQRIDNNTRGHAFETSVNDSTFLKNSQVLVSER